MSTLSTDEVNYSNIADAIRERLESEDQITPGEMAEAVHNIAAVKGIKGAAETGDYRTGYVEISSEDIGALEKDATAVRSIADENGNNIASTYQQRDNVTSKGNETTPVYFDENGEAKEITSYSGLADQASKDSDGNVIVSTYKKKEDLVSKGSVTTPIYFDENGEAQPITSYEGSVTHATTADKATADANGNNISSTYAKVNDFKDIGSTTIPVYFDENGKATPITSYSGKADSAKVADKAVADSDGNQIQDTYLKKEELVSKGSSVVPVYFDANGKAQPITSYSGKSASSDKLETPRNITIAGVSKEFDGTADVSYSTEELKILKPAIDGEMLKFIYA